MPTLVIRSLQDFATVPKPQLMLCVKALLSAVRDATPGSPITELTVDVSPRPIRRSGDGPLSGATQLSELRLRRESVAALAQQNIYCIEDLTLISADEVLAMPGMGRTGVALLRDALQAVGLTFGVHDDEERAMWARARAAHATPASVRAQRLTSDSDVRDLGLRIPTLMRVLGNGIETIGALQAMPISRISRDHGRSQTIEIVRVLAEVGLPISQQVSPREQWRAGLIERDALVVPTDPDTPIGELMPWLGQKVVRLQQGGVRTLGALKALPAERLRAVRGLGDRSVQEIERFLGVAKPAPAALPWFGHGEQPPR